MKFLLLVVLVWIVSDGASTVAGRVIMDLEDSRLNLGNPEPDVSSLARSKRSHGGTAGEHQYRNVALGGRATQSTILRDSVYHTGYMASAMNAIDGNRNSNYHHGSCSHTHDDLSPWWRVDLLRSYRIGHITITNRGDCCGNRLRGAEILVGNSLADNGNNNPRCAVVTTILDGETQTFQCNDMVGRYVNVHLPGKKECLQLCEVEVYGANLVHETKNYDSNNNQNTEN